MSLANKLLTITLARPMPLHAHDIMGTNETHRGWPRIHINSRTSDSAVELAKINSYSLFVKSIILKWRHKTCRLLVATLAYWSIGSLLITQFYALDYAYSTMQEGAIVANFFSIGS